VQNKREQITSPRNAPISDTTPSVPSQQNFQGEIEQGSGPSFSFSIVSRISGQLSVELFKQLRSSWGADQLSCS
jgi:hypothetical protein